ncbi:MAG TPA: hypothetical protein VHI77_10305 [Solirubrobacterales bacterium]|nr:hypothetical protein [Solirubrobacterales bacterium]
MRATRLAPAFACLLAAAAALAGCGGSGTGSSAGSADSRPAPAKGAFPSAEGRTLRELLDQVADKPSELVVSPAALVFYKGQNRYPFGVFEKDRSQVGDAEVALYFSHVPTPTPGAKSKPGHKGQQAKADARALDQPAVGPFPAKIESLQTQPAFRAQTTVNDPDAASVVYSAPIDFPSEGEWQIAALIKEGDEVGATLLPSAVVGEYTNIPRPGQPAPKIHTPTPGDVGGDLSKITTRVPADTQNRVDFAQALGKEPILLLFATPQFCQSRVCGPVVDVAEEAKEEYGDKAAFIHMEIYEENDPNKGVRPQVRAFHLPSEPWLFAVNRHGVVSSVVEGAFGKELMDATVEKVVSE